jgi:hypothetical protein
MERRDDPFTGPLGYYDPSPYDRRIEHDELLADAERARSRQQRRGASRRTWWQFWRRSERREGNPI